MDLYQISFPGLTSKVYIGISASGAKGRFAEHCASKKKYPIVLALKKYGKENAVLTVLGRFNDWEKLYAGEKKAIAHYGSKAPHGYNLTDGGPGTFGLPASEERKRKISEANRGRKASDETRKKISEANKNRSPSSFKNAIAAMAASTRGIKLSPERVEAIRQVWIGRKHSEESKQKMSESAKRRKASDETRKKMSDALKGRIISPETLKKRAETLARKKLTQWHP